MWIIVAKPRGVTDPKLLIHAGNDARLHLKVFAKISHLVSFTLMFCIDQLNAENHTSRIRTTNVVYQTLNFSKAYDCIGI